MFQRRNCVVVHIRTGIWLQGPWTVIKEAWRWQFNKRWWCKCEWQAGWGGVVLPVPCYNHGWSDFLQIFWISLSFYYHYLNWSTPTCISYLNSLCLQKFYQILLRLHMYNLGSFDKWFGSQSPFTTDS